MAPDSTILNSLAGTSNYEIPKNSVKLSKFFSEVEGKKESVGITDWGISNTTLEEVFLKTTAEDFELKYKKQEAVLSKLGKLNNKGSDFELEDVDVESAKKHGTNQ